MEQVDLRDKQEIAGEKKKEKKAKRTVKKYKRIVNEAYKKFAALLDLGHTHWIAKNDCHTVDGVNLWELDRRGNGELAGPSRVFKTSVRIKCGAPGRMVAMLWDSDYESRKRWDGYELANIRLLSRMGGAPPKDPLDCGSGKIYELVESYVKLGYGLCDRRYFCVQWRRHNPEEGSWMLVSKTIEGGDPRFPRSEGTEDIQVFSGVYVQSLNGGTEALCTMLTAVEIPSIIPEFVLDLFIGKFPAYLRRLTTVACDDKLWDSIYGGREGQGGSKN